MRVTWRTQGVRYGNAYGYARSNEALQAAFLAAGGVCDDTAPIAFAFCYPTGYAPVPDRTNVLFTMFESADLSTTLLDAMDAVDAVIVPSAFCRDIFRNATDRPIYLCPLGVDAERWLPVARSRARNRPFRWFWAGAHNARKGWIDLFETWDTYFAGRDDCELYVKTTGTEFPNCIGHGTGRRTNVTLDTRNISDDEMHRLYRAADGFVLPHMGEGFSLVALEAMATGLPVVMTCVTGETEFADATVCRPVRYVPIEAGIAEYDGGPVSPSWVVRAEQESIAAEMTWVMTHWERARRMGIRAAKRAQQFTWAAAGRRLRTVFEHIAAGSLPDVEEVTHGGRVSHS